MRLVRPQSHKIFGRSLTTWNHPALRRYFIGRNNILLFREYFYRLPADLFELLRYVLKTAVKICAVERERHKKLSYLLLGIWHGLLGRMDGEPGGRTGSLNSEVTLPATFQETIQPSPTLVQQQPHHRGKPI